MRFALIPEEVVAACAATLRNENPESAEAQALSDWLDINRDHSLASQLMGEQDAREFLAALAIPAHEETADEPPAVDLTGAIWRALDAGLDPGEVRDRVDQALSTWEPE